MDNTSLVRNIVRVGNSAGILLPKAWLNGMVKVDLIKKPLNIKQDILEILDEYLEDIVGIYLVGSYARKEQTNYSDVDVLVITDNFEERIKKGKYDLWLIPKRKLVEQIKNNALPLLPMIKEASSIINSKLLEEYKNIPLNWRNLKFHIETTKSALQIARATLEIIKLKQEDKCSDAFAYSLILRLREVYIVDCLMNNKSFSNKGLKNLIKSLANSLTLYDSYLRSKNNERKYKVVPIADAESILSYVSNRIMVQEQWIKKEGNK